MFKNTIYWKICRNNNNNYTSKSFRQTGTKKFQMVQKVLNFC